MERHPLSEHDRMMPPAGQEALYSHDSMSLFENGLSFLAIAEQLMDIGRRFPFQDLTRAVFFPRNPGICE